MRRQVGYSRMKGFILSVVAPIDWTTLPSLREVEGIVAVVIVDSHCNGAT